ncbi:Imm44 family immunity protein [Runella sp. SP2]|uniref:Imm44 family immunity protein n=1 Tax=Runella sp. SP2 TaxID=2268026 RepID=UPI000F07622A|nr:Imm44 family immunity protein [Runella sp. SP2]AYQ30991.1 hypothetical protein DTQ70_01815 [Runella sp. SP2]
MNSNERSKMRLTFGSEISNGIPFPFFTTDLEDLINITFQSKKYGDNILTIYSGFICVSKEYEFLHPIRKPKLLRKEAALEFEYKLDFEIYKNMNDEQRKKYVATEYFENLKGVFEKKKIKDFDSESFLKDLEILLKEQGLLT